MKFLKYIVFLSILISIFFVIYPQSNEKGFHKWYRPFKIAVLIAVSGAGLLLANTEVMLASGNNNQVYQERLFSGQEFNLLKENID